MRLVQLMVPSGKRKSIRETLEAEGIDYVMTDETSGREYAAVIYFPLPTGAVEGVLDALQDDGIEEDAYTVVVDAETVLSAKFDALREEYEGGDVEEERISRQELRSHAEELTPVLGVFLTLTVVSALVATAGLLLDSAAVVVGSMVIAPLIGPALGTSVGTVLNDDEMVATGVSYQLLGIVVAIGAAAAFAWAIRAVNVVPPGLDITQVTEISERLTPGLLSLVIALGAGVAGVFSISTGVSVALVGVMIAAALIPPAAAAGIALAWGQPLAAIGSAALVFVNVLSVNLAGLVTLWYTGYRPDSLFDVRPTKQRVRRRAAGLVVVVLVFSAFLGGITYASHTTSTFENDARMEVEETLEGPTYENYRLVGLEVSLDDDFPFRGPERVVVTVSRPPGQTPAELAAQLHDRINRHAEETVTVEVRYVDVIEE